MPTEALVLASVMGPVYLVAGLSMLFYGKSWQVLMEKWSKDHFLLFPLMFVYMIFGLISVRLYNVWVWNVGLLVTLTGWCLLVKGVYFFLAPGAWITPLLEWKNSKAWISVGGVLTLIIGVVLNYYVYFV